MLWRSLLNHNLPKISNIRTIYIAKGTFPAADARSIYHPRVSYLWSPHRWTLWERSAKKALREQARSAFGVAPSGWIFRSSDVEEISIKTFFLPYWLVRVALYSNFDFATAKREHTRGRISIDITFGLSGSDHFALQKLHFWAPSHTVRYSDANKLPPLPEAVYIPFSVGPSMPNLSRFFKNLPENNGVSMSGNARIPPGLMQTRIGAHPVLEPVVLGEFCYSGRYLTVAHCPRDMNDARTRVYQGDKWLHDPSFTGQPATEFSLAWEDGVQPRGTSAEVYKNLELSIHKKVEYWIKSAQPLLFDPTKPNEATWEDVSVGKESLDTVRKWRTAKLNLWQEGISD